MRWTWTLALAVMLSGVPATFADIPPPPPPPHPSTPAGFVVEIDPNVSQPRLIVPRKIIVRKAGLDAPADENLTDAADDEVNQTWNRTLLAGASLAVAASCAGLWLVRRSRTGTGMALLLTGIALFAGSAIVYANAPPPRPRPRPQPVQLEQFYSGKIDVEYIAQGDSVKLVLPVELARKWGKPGAGAVPGGVGSGPPPTAKPNDPRP